MLWNAIKTSLHGALPESEFGLWIKPLECRRQDDQVLELAGPDRFFCAWVEDRYLELIRTKAQELGDRYRYSSAGGRASAATGGARQGWTVAPARRQQHRSALPFPASGLHL